MTTAVLQLLQKCLWAVRRSLTEADRGSVEVITDITEAEGSGRCLLEVEGASSSTGCNTAVLFCGTFAFISSLISFQMVDLWINLEMASVTELSVRTLVSRATPDSFFLFTVSGVAHARRPFCFPARSPEKCSKKCDKFTLLLSEA